MAEGDGGGPTAYSTDGVVLYTPTQAETNYTSFLLIAKKTGCIPASITVVTTASATNGNVVLSGETHTSAVIPTVTTCTTTTNNTDMRGTNSAALASVATEARLAELDAGNLPTDIAAIPTTAMRGTDSAALASVATEARLAELDAANLPTDIAAIPTTAMRGTDSAALASVATEARLAELDAANLPTDIAAIPTTAMRGTDSAALASVATEARLAELDAGNLPTDIAAIPTTAMRGTDSAATAASVAALNNVAATDIVSAGAITTLTGAVVNVDSVDTIALAGRVLVANQVWANDITTWEGVTDSAAYTINNSDDQSAAAVSALTTAQADLDKLTGSDGATLATAQANYAPATATALSTVSTTIGAAGAGLTEAGGTGDHLTAMPWNAAWDAEVESEVNDAIDTAISELGVGAPTATPTIRTGMMLMYMALRNKTVTQTSGTDALEVYNNAGDIIAKKLLTDVCGDYTAAEMVSG